MAFEMPKLCKVAFMHMYVRTLLIMITSIFYIGSKKWHGVLPFSLWFLKSTLWTCTTSVFSRLLWIGFLFPIKYDAFLLMYHISG